MSLNYNMYARTYLRVLAVKTRLQQKLSTFAFIICFRQWETSPKFEVEMPHQGIPRRSFMRRVAPQRQLRCESTSERTPSIVLHKEHRLVITVLSKMSELCLNDKEMIITSVNCLHILASFSTMKTDPVDYRTDMTTKVPNYPLTCEESPQRRLI